MDLSQYMGMFLEESKEHLQNLNQGLLGLEQNPEDVRLVNEIFRSAHTLKGMSATMGFSQIAEITHQMENVLQKFRSGEVQVHGSIIDTMFRCLDCLEDMVDVIANGDTPEADTSAIMAALQQCMTEEPKPETPAPAAAPTDGVPKVETVLETIIPPGIVLNEFEKNVVLEGQQQGYKPIHLAVSINPACIMKAARSLMVFKRLEELGEIIKSVPSVSDIEDEKFDHTFEVIILTSADQETVIKAVAGVAEVDPPVITYLNIRKADDGRGSIQEPCAAGEEVAAAVAPLAPNTVTDTKGSAAKAAPAVPAKHLTTKPKAATTIRVEIDRLDMLMNLVGELVINKTRLAQIGKYSENHDLSETVEQMDRVFVDLQNLVMKVRMVPIEQVFNRFPRMVRDLAKDLGKDIELIIEGEETELDRTVIDEIGDPLVHLLRNSVDHGIESPEERENAGKARVATVKLSARHEGNNVIIEVTDNGRGIDPARIRAKALEKGLLTPKEAEQMDDNAAINLIFAPGFSTAEKVSDVSGRGVGLDAVRSKIEALSGECRLFSTAGEGTVFRIQLPLTLAIIQALLVRVGEETYATPLSFIDETTSIFSKDIKQIQEQDSMLLRGHVLPLVRLDSAVGLPARVWEPDEELMVVVVRRAGKTLGLLVDELVGQQEVVIKALGELVGGLPGIGGATILGDGTVALILDISTLV
ncbi:MAG TPA: chemotaxis protein CheA [Bacillota bacterium]|nr:chemotaxis protein CheA [Bacillota bacterium]